MMTRSHLPATFRALAVTLTFLAATLAGAAPYGTGTNINGQLGDGTTTQRTAFTAVDTSGVLAGKTIVAVAASSTDGTSSHTLALDSAGRVYAWGRGGEGQLGDGTTTQRTTPVAVDVSGVLAGKTIVAVSAGAYHSLALDSAGRVYAWGYNANGRLGDATTTSRNSPVA